MNCDFHECQVRENKLFITITYLGILPYSTPDLFSQGFGTSACSIESHSPSCYFTSYVLLFVLFVEANKLFESRKCVVYGDLHFIRRRCSWCSWIGRRKV